MKKQAKRNMTKLWAEVACQEAWLLPHGDFTEHMLMRTEDKVYLFRDPEATPRLLL